MAGFYMKRNTGLKWVNVRFLSTIMMMLAPSLVRNTSKMATLSVRLTWIKIVQNCYDRLNCYTFNKALCRQHICNNHCVKSVCISGFYGPYFLAFGLNMERYSVSLRIQSKCGKIRTRKTPITDIFPAVNTFKRLIHLE